MKKLIKHFLSEWYKYVLEILVVIIGILIAFALNNWNENIKDRNLKDSYLEALALDVQGDIANLKSWKVSSDNAEKESLYLLEFLEKRITEIDSQRLARSFLLCQFKPAITINSSTYSDLINSGNMRVFEDIALKKQLDEYYKVDTWSVKIDERITQSFWYDFRDKITEFIDPTIFKRIYIARPFTNKAEKEDLLDYDIDWNGLKESPELLRHLRSGLAFRVVIKENLINHIEKAQNLLSTINLESN